jgi:PadR family transcriptional regulator, regulatory protein PadR
MYCMVLKFYFTLCHYSRNKKLSMDIQNTQSQMRKGVLEFCILSIIRQGEVYPSDIVDKMKGANLNILEGTLYPLLTRLKNAGYLTYRWVESNSGPPRKYFLMTDQGLQFYDELERTWNELADAVQKLTSENGKENLPEEIPNNNQ